MNSLTKRLRNFKHGENLNKKEIEKLCIEAAEEIEKSERQSKIYSKEIESLKKQILLLKKKNLCFKNQNARIKRETHNNYFIRGQE